MTHGALAIARCIHMHALDLDHSDWDDAHAVKITRYWSGQEAPPARHSEARLLWSADAIFARFSCNQSEPMVVNPNPNLREKTLGLWDRDVCEIFIAPGPDFRYRYLEFEAAPTGEWVDLAIHLTPHSRETDWKFNSGMSNIAHVAKGLVTIAIRIPWKAFGNYPKQGDKWHGNLFRCVGSGEQRGYLAWQPTLTKLPNFHVSSAFGLFEFEG